MSIQTRSCPMWCTLHSTRTMTWISECGGLITLLQPSHPLCYQGSSAVFVSLGGQRYPKGLLLPRWKRACGVTAELPLGQMYQAPHASTGPWRPKETNCTSREGSNLTQPSPGFNPEDAAAVIISDDDETSFPTDTPQAISTLKIELTWSQKQPLEERSPRSSPPKNWATEEKEGVCLLMKPFSPEGC